MFLLNETHVAPDLVAFRRFQFTIAIRLITLQIVLTKKRYDSRRVLERFSIKPKMTSVILCVAFLWKNGYGCQHIARTWLLLTNVAGRSVRFFVARNESYTISYLVVQFLRIVRSTLVLLFRPVVLLLSWIHSAPGGGPSAVPASDEIQYASSSRLKSDCKTSPKRSTKRRNTSTMGTWSDAF